MRILALAAGMAALMGSSAIAEGFQPIKDKNKFVSVVQDRELKRLGIRVKVTDDGRIVGRAFGQSVTGSWRWDEGFFCRDLAWGGDPLGFNCQLVQVNGETVRFTSDKGAGIYADLKVD